MENAKPTNFELVKRWMEKASQATPGEPSPMPDDTARLRQRLVLEEALETHDAFNAYRKDKEDPDLAADLVKELADILVVVYGAFAAMGVDADRAFVRVMENNFDKLTAFSYDLSGKVVVDADRKAELKRAVHLSLLELLV